VWFSPTKKRRRSLHDLLFATSTLSDSAANEDQPADTRRANKRAKIASVEEDVDMFRNVRLSHDGLLDRLNSFNYDVASPLDTSQMHKLAITWNEAFKYVKENPRRFWGPRDIEAILEILQTYQRESTPIQDVYSEIKNLFSSAPDLVVEFKQFVPESVAADIEVQTTRTAFADADKGRGRKRRRD
jgi:hypothetical protein